MSNHDVGYTFNRAFDVLGDLGILDELGKDKSKQIMKKFMMLTLNSNGNSHEALEGYEEFLGICPQCMNDTDEFGEHGVCPECEKEY